MHAPYHESNLRMHAELLVLTILVDSGRNRVHQLLAWHAQTRAVSDQTTGAESSCCLAPSEPGLNALPMRI